MTVDDTHNDNLAYIPNYLFISQYSGTFNYIDR